MPKAPKSKPCSSKRAAALMKSPPALGWDCRSWARLGLPTGRDGLLRGDMGNTRSIPVPAGELDAWVQKWFEFLVGTAEASINRPFCSPLGFLLPLGAVALPCLVLVLPQEGFAPPQGSGLIHLHPPTHHDPPVSPWSVGKSGCPWPCPAAPCAAPARHDGAAAARAKEALRRLRGFRMGASPPLLHANTPRVSQGEGPYLADGSCLPLPEASERFGNASHPSPCPKSRLGA